MQANLIVSLLIGSHCNALIARGQDHSGHYYPVQYLENIGPAKEQSDWLILAIGPLAAEVVK